MKMNPGIYHSHCCSRTRIDYCNIVAIAALCLVLVWGCKSSEKITIVTDKSAYKFYCSDSAYRSTSEYIRWHKIGNSVDQATSLRKAIQMAQLEMVGSLKSALRHSMESYISTKGSQYDEYMKKQVAEVSDKVSKELTQKVNIVCEETNKTRDGLYQTYIVIEISGIDVFTELQHYLSQNTQFKIKINPVEFKKIFERELKNMSEKQIN